MIIVKLNETAHSVWTEIHNLFLSNTAHRFVYTLHEFPNLY